MSLGGSSPNFDRTGVATRRASQVAKDLNSSNHYYGGMKKQTPA